MTGDDILKLAGDLLARDIRSPSEALCRNIVGRSYYGAYHLALNLLADLGVQKSNDHKAPVRWLIGSGEPSAKKAGQLLDDLYAARRRADYELDRQRAITESRDTEFVKSQVELAKSIKTLLDACAVEPVRSQVMIGIHTFRQRQSGKPGIH